MTTDIDIARLIAANLLPSPFPFYNSVLIKLRLSGSGVSYRRKHDEFVYRDPKLYLSQEFADRWRGVALVENHPAEGMLDGETFVSSICGIITYAFPEGDELKGIARIFDKRIAEVLEEGSYTTSPAVIDPNGVMVKVGDDSVLCEFEPSVIDHVALIHSAEGEAAGVWDKGDPSNLGVEITSDEKEQTNA
jgi:colicin import membrane protein